MQTILSTLLFLTLLGGIHTQLHAQHAPSERHQKAYHFEHKLIPNWLYNSDGAFFESIEAGEISRLQDVATEVVDKKFGQQLKVETIEPNQAYLIIFETPEDPPLCYCAIICRTSDGYAYYTLEKTYDFGEENAAKTMFCAWTMDGSHENLGPRGYTSPETFTEEYLKNKDKL